MRPVAHPSPLGWKAECFETLRMAGPLAAANLLQMLTYAVDVMFKVDDGEMRYRLHAASNINPFTQQLLSGYQIPRSLY